VRCAADLVPAGDRVSGVAAICVRHVTDLTARMAPGTRHLRDPCQGIHDEVDRARSRLFWRAASLSGVGVVWEAARGTVVRGEVVYEMAA
jgi:hypothetical protein